MRQVHPSQITEGRPASSTFTPTARDGGHLSSDRESLLPAKEAYEKYLAKKSLMESGGVWAVTVGEVEGLGLKSYEDAIEGNAAHALIDFTPCGDAKKQKLKGLSVYAAAKARGRLHP